MWPALTTFVTLISFSQNSQLDIPPSANIEWLALKEILRMPIGYAAIPLEMDQVLIFL